MRLNFKRIRTLSMFKNHSQRGIYLNLFCNKFYYPVLRDKYYQYCLGHAIVQESFSFNLYSQLWNLHTMHIHSDIASVINANIVNHITLFFKSQIVE